MKLLIASDIHGDEKCCRNMLEAASNENAERILLLGDLLYHGPRNDLPQNYAPKKVIELLNSNASNLLCVRGNCEADVDQMVLNFPVLSETAFVYDGDTKITLFMSHGHKYSPQSLPPLPSGSVFLSGHTHIPSVDKINGTVCINPGSVSLPKGGYPSGYAVYSNGRIDIKTFEGEIISSADLRKFN